MAVVEWTAQAEEDLIDIWGYISQDNPAAADDLLDEIDGKCALLAANPDMGPARSDIAPELRYFPVGRNLLPRHYRRHSGRARCPRRAASF